MKKVISLLLLLLVIIAIIPLFLPKSIHKEAEYIYDYNVDVVYNAFANTKKFSKWYDWADSNNKSYEFSNPASGVNASYVWKDEEGEVEGRVKITQTQQNEFVFYEFQIPGDPSHTGEVILTKLDDGRTKVVFTFDSAEETYPYQVYYYLIQSKIQKNIEKNLKNLENYLAETSSNNSNQVGELPVETRVENLEILGYVQETSFNEEEFTLAKEESLAMIYSYLKDALQLEEDIIGNPYTYYIKYDQEDDVKTMIFGYPVQNKVEAVEGMEYFTIDGGKVITLKYNPRLTNLSNTLIKIRNFANQENLVLGNRFWEKELPGDEMQVFYIID